MEFTPMDAAAYRALSNEEFELRRSAVRDELGNPESTVSMELLRSEVAIINEEAERRAAAAAIVVENRSAVAAGAGTVLVESAADVKPAGAQSEAQKRDAALRSDEYKAEFRRYMSTRDAKLSDTYEAFQRMAEGDDPAPAATDPAYGILEDAGILVPLDIRDTIIEKMEDRGKIWNEVNKTNERGGIDIPVGNFSMEASWIGEQTVSDPQTIDKLDDKISFRYHILECRHANTLLSEIVGPRAYMSKYAESASNAMVDAIETAIMRGSGSSQPLGILSDTRLTVVSKMKADDFTVKGVMSKIKNPIAKLGSAYRGGKLYVSETTWNYYCDGMTDTNGQPVARVNYGIDGDITYRLFGLPVEVLDEKYLPFFDDTTAKGDVFGLYGDLRNYTVNSNMQLRADRWEDKDSNLFKSRLLMIADGRVVDPYGFIKFTGLASA